MPWSGGCLNVESATYGRLARLSLVTLFVMLSQACLLVGEPNTDPPKRTPPVLRRPDPPDNEFIRLVRNANQKYDSVVFRAEVSSEDVADELNTSLLIDYGKTNPSGDPWLNVQGGGILPPTTLASGWRDITIAWTPNENLTGAGCHTITMLVTHQLAGTNGFFCPKDPDDYDTQSWMVVLCENDPDNCDFSGCLVDGAQSTSDTTVGFYCDSPPLAQTGGT